MGARCKLFPSQRLDGVIGWGIARRLRFSLLGVAFAMLTFNKTSNGTRRCHARVNQNVNIKSVTTEQCQKF